MPDMRDLEIDQYLAEVNVVVDDLGGRANFVGLCQGGWISAMYAARFPHKVASLVLAGAPIDTDAGNGPVKGMARTLPMSFDKELVATGGGLMRGELMLQAWKGMHPAKHYISGHIELYERIDDPAYLRKKETFESWYENPIDLPGRWYLQAILQLFKDNRLAKGSFVGLGRRLDLPDVTCPVYLLAGESDDITTREQVFDAEKYLGTPRDQIEKKLIPGGHIGLFMGAAPSRTPGRGSPGGSGMRGSRDRSSRTRGAYLSRQGLRAALCRPGMLATRRCPKRPRDTCGDVIDEPGRVAFPINRRAPGQAHRCGDLGELRPLSLVQQAGYLSVRGLAKRNGRDRRAVESLTWIKEAERGLCQGIAGVRAISVGGRRECPAKNRPRPF